MRKRYDSNGDLIGYHSMVFDNIPDDYKIKSIMLKDKVFDLPYLGVMRYLRDKKVDYKFSDDKFYSVEVISHLALDYLNSAHFLWQGIMEDRNKDIVSYYFIPCAFMCKHSIELKLKECLLVKGAVKLSGHSVKKLWDDIGDHDIPNFEDISDFIAEVEEIDINETALRYGINGNLKPLAERPVFDIDNLITNTMFLFNVLDEYVVCKYR